MSDFAPAAALRVAIFTLGCKLNQYESDALASEFRAAGFTVVEAEDGADVFVVNSCTVTNRAGRKSRNLATRAERQLDSARLVVLTGCHSQTDQSAHPERVLVVDNRHKHRICQLVMERLAEPNKMTGAANFAAGPDSGPGDPFGLPPAIDGFHTRATVKIQDGCDSFCSYCIIPRVRGPAISRPAASIQSEILTLCAAGFREIVLTGVNMARWSPMGSPAPHSAPASMDFAGLIRSILDLELPAGQDFRLRLSSLEPEGLGPDFADLFSHPRLCPSLQLCLQSGSPAILDGMKRSYTLEEYRALVRKLRAVDPLFTLSTDLITGFPGETEGDFALSLAALDEFNFFHVHVFPYSRREGTAADGYPGQLPDRVKDGRASQIRSLDKPRRHAWMERFAGRPLRLLVEGIRVLAGDASYRLSGHCEYGFPVQLDVDGATLQKVAAGLGQPAGKRLAPPAIRRSQEQAAPADRAAIAAVWNSFVKVHAGLAPDDSAEALPVSLDKGLS